MMITDLSEDLVEDILSRVPATSLKRLRTTCKQWNTLFKDVRFAKTHFGKAAKEFKVLMLKENRFYSVSINLNGIASPIKFKGRLCLKGFHNNTSKHDYISKVFHCDGLLLCTTNEHKLVVWNPILGETRWIQHKNVYEENAVFALGYRKTSSSSCRSYKILKYLCHKEQNGRVVYGCEIFGLSSESWRVLDVAYPDECIVQSPSSVSLKGNTYWRAYKKNEGLVLLGFDYSTETFKCLSLPFQGLSFDTIALSVVREEKLLLLHQSFKTLKLDIWVTTSNIDEAKALSWSKFLAVDLYTHNFLLSIFGNFFIDEEKKVAMCIGKEDKWNFGCIIGDDGKYREFSLEESRRWPFVFNYVPSLVQIQ